MAPESPYKTALQYKRTPPATVPDSAPDDRDRVTAYETYTDLYRNQVDIFKNVLQLEDGQDLYTRLVPVVRTIVEATNRYLGQGLTWVATPPDAAAATDAGAGTDGSAAIAETMGALNALFDREGIIGKFMSLKRWMLIRGDAVLHVTADPSKPQGTQVRIVELNPSSYFALTDPSDDTRITGVYLVNVIPDDAGDDIAARLEYQRVLTDTDSQKFNGAPIGTVFMRLTFWEVDGWDDRFGGELAAVPTPSRFNTPEQAALLGGTTLPPAITAIPVYLFRNPPYDKLYGVSEVQGVETLLNGVSQAATDQDLAVAMTGLGVYWTDSGRPRDADGTEIPWSIGPAALLELMEGKTMNRLQGLTTVQPSVDHIAMLSSQARETTGTPDIAVGAVDVKVAESGVSRAIQFSPVIAKNQEKEEEIKGKLNQMLFDLLTGWLPSFDGYTDNGVRVKAEFGPALPVSATEVVNQLTALVDKRIVSGEWARTYLTSQLGWTFPVNEADVIAQEGSSALDATGARLDAAIAGGTGADGGGGTAA